jgi:Zn-dependent peptidase ImmA (M78 family)/transcriptional regulator with XRE-family HTH domain
MSQDVAAKKLHVSVQRLKAWEQGEANPTVRQLRIAARVYRQSLAFFFLPSVPDDLAPTLEDFRRLPSDEEHTMSPALAREVRESSIRREIAVELSQLMGEAEATPTFDLAISRSESPERVGEKLREYLGMSLAVQYGWSDPRIAFNSWRHAVEQVGILVFQAADVEVSEMRGFSIARYPLPAVVVNRRDAYVGRVFTLLHEIVHLGLRSSALCDLVEKRGGGWDEVEVFCNHAAGAALVPTTALLEQEVVKESRAAGSWTEKVVEALARRFSSSREVIARRLLILGLVPQQFYESRRREYTAEGARVRRQRGYVPPSTDSISKNGPFLVKLVFSSLRENLITPNDAADYLGVRMKHFDRIEERVGAL